MARFLVRRLAILPFALLLVHFSGYAYALLGRWFQQKLNPFFAASRTPPPILREYLTYAQTALQTHFGKMPGGSPETIWAAVLRTGGNSLGLLGLAFAISLLVGLLLGLLAARTDPPGVFTWLVPASAVSLSMPSFYIGAVMLTATIFYLLYWAPPGAKLPFPLHGYGWDDHLVLPVMVLAVRPAMQIAQVTSAVLSDELRKQYVVAGRSFGHTWRRIRWRTALSNVLAPMILAVGNSFRLLVVELILVEWLFGWPGLGRLFADTLFRPQVASIFNPATTVPERFLYPPIVAAVLTTFAALFLFSDTLASALVRAVDPRYRGGEEGVKPA